MSLLVRLGKAEGSSEENHESKLRNHPTNYKQLHLATLKKNKSEYFKLMHNLY